LGLGDGRARRARRPGERLAAALARRAPRRPLGAVLQCDAAGEELVANLVGTAEVARFPRRGTLGDQPLDLGGVDAARVEVASLLVVEIATGGRAQHAEDTGHRREVLAVRRQRGAIAGVEETV